MDINRYLNKFSLKPFFIDEAANDVSGSSDAGDTTERNSSVEGEERRGEEVREEAAGDGMFCWGNTSNGELGLGGIEEQAIPTPREVKFSLGNKIKSVSCGASHTLVLLNNGEVYSCGNNDYGQLGHAKSRTKLQVIDSLGAYKIAAVACGEQHSLALEQWGQVFSWGSDAFGQLGLNSGEVTVLKPKIIKALITSHVLQIACGHRHCLALTNKGELFAWGLNDCGQLGLGSKARTVPTPTFVSSLIGLPITFIACGGYHSFVLSKSGAVYGWGKNSFGQLGLNTEVDHIFPSQLKTLRSIKVKYIVCGEDFSVFLTQEGGVLTCGAGAYGQLGHGGVSSEVLPRKIIELMGSTVTQIACGRRHTLAFVASRDKVFAFGLGSSGQLGTKQGVNSSVPMVVQGPWLSGKSFVEKIFSGGDQCFATVTAKRKPSDYRHRPAESLVWTVTPEKMLECQNVPESQSVDQELLTYLETVLASQACVNGSFLLPRDQHFCCTSRHHGIDLNVAQACFSAISKANNPSIRDVYNLTEGTVNIFLYEFRVSGGRPVLRVAEGLDQVSSCLEAVISMIPRLPSSPPDVETLRLYLTLPMYHEFDNARHSIKLQGPFAAAFHNLKLEASKIVGVWYSMSSDEYFERLVRIYKNVVILLLKEAARSGKALDPEYVLELNHCEKIVIDCLNLLDLLSKLNNSKSALRKLNYEIFYLPELTELVDIRLDYVKWAIENPNHRAIKKFFCNYPFLFDAQAKTTILQTDQSFQMHNAVTQAAHQAVHQMFFSPVAYPILAFLELHVSRNNIVEDTIRELSNYSERDYKKPLKVHFLDEEAEDAGGVKKEFFLLLLREILDAKYGMFRSDEESNAIWFSEDSFEDETMYYLVGLLCGLAIYNFIIINLPFPLALYKKLLGEAVDLQDLRDLFPSLAKGLQSLLDYEGNDVEDVFCLKFEVQRSSFGQVITTELKSNGSNISVTSENKKEYVDLYVEHILNTSIERHYRAFHDGFHKVLGSGRGVVELFHAQELMAVVIGNENYDWEEFENGAEYKGDFNSSHPTIRMFWEVFHELPETEKKKFLLFLTGCDRIPIQGMKAIKIIIQPAGDDRFLPVAHTCFNLLDLPRYSTKERLRYKLTQAIQYNQGFHIV